MEQKTKVKIVKADDSFLEPFVGLEGTTAEKGKSGETVAVDLKSPGRAGQRVFVKPDSLEVI